MGKTISKNFDICSNEYCMRFVGKESISINDPFWNRFLSFTLVTPITSDDQLALETKIEPLCQELLKNNLKTGNLNSLIRIFITRSSELLSAANTDANIFTWQLFNSILAVRCVLKFLSQEITEIQFIKHIEVNENENIFETLIGTLVGIIVDIPVENKTYLIHLEAISCLLVCLSVQHNSGERLEQSTIFRLMMKGRHVIHAPILVRSLLTNFINQEKLPPEYSGNDGHNIVFGLASNIWSMLTFSKTPTDELVIRNQNDFMEAPLATQSLLLLLVLVHHFTTHPNPYRNSLFSCLDSQDSNPVPPKNVSTLFKVDYNSLYKTIWKKASGDAATLLLYSLLHKNISFKSFVLQRLDLDNLILPILKALYNAPNSNSHHIYMSLIILLILSEDDDFDKTVHDVKLRSVDWYVEKSLTDISLGGLIILVLIRTVQYNMLKMRDKYLHTNCLAALANMSSQFRDLHPYVCQRLLSVFESLTKKYHRLTTLPKYKDAPEETKVDLTTSQEAADAEQDVSVLEEVIRMLLEILNSCLIAQIGNNYNLIYSLLYNKHMFNALKNDVVFQDIVQNINSVIQYFSQLLHDKSKEHEVDAPRVLLVVQEGTRSWPRERLTKFPELKFKYVEEDQPEDFFIPYVWALVNQQSTLN
ncbi:unnamed protein product [Phaedon cochleariae]|uniref:Dymeclin n=1 Tax=Phaedon cochleariae TaxID=80249 RepID=A0A9P0DPY8_PHACE|nr:unnamed protein product [Phaedon cochleariae]